MPAEWEPQAATWLGWPHNRSDWPGKFPPIPWVYAEIVRHLARVQRVEILVQDATAERRARAVLKHSGARNRNIRFHRFATNRGWTRDFCPIFVKRANARRPLALVNWRFNGWAKYPNWRQDEHAAQKIVRRLKLPVWEPSYRTGSAKPRRVVLEGGSIDVNGRGTLITTEECLLSRVQQRNPGLGRADLENILGDYLGIKKVLWLERGIAGDDTHGHVDDIARFVAPDTVVTVVEPNRSDANHEPLRANLQRLRQMTDQAGRRLQIAELPMPSPVVFQGQRLPASYANFYIANQLVLVPVFNDPKDQRALNILAELFPSREIVPIYCRDLVWGLGTIHCMTMQQPE
jgi:agmatine deiminase